MHVVVIIHLIFIFSIEIVIIDDIKTSRIKQQVKKFIPQMCELRIFSLFSVYHFSLSTANQYNFGKLCNIVYNDGLGN